MYVRTDNVNVRVFPPTKSGGRLNGNALFPFQIHGIHLGSDTVFPTDIVNGVDSTRIVQDSFRQCGLATVCSYIYVKRDRRGKIMYECEAEF